MEWESDVTAGTWIAERLTGDVQSMHGCVPTGFEAYARVLHTPFVRSAAGGPVPTERQLKRMKPAERDAAIATFVDEPTTWAATAQAFGTTLHPLAQWNRLVRAQPGEQWNSVVAPDGREFTAASVGETEPEMTSAIVAAMLGGAGPTPGHAGLWEGSGGLVGSYGSTGRTFFTVGESTTADTDPEVAWRHDQMLNSSMRDPFNSVFQQPTWVDGILSREVSEGPRLELPGRTHVLFAGDVSMFTRPDWIADTPWRDRIAEAHGFPVHSQTPSLIWPDDRSWIVVTEVDFDSTIVGGSRASIDRLVAAPSLEAFEIPAGADLTWDADVHNA